MSLNELAIGEGANIFKICTEGPLKKRLQALGFVEKSYIEVIGKAPLGDPLIVDVRGTQLAIRRKDAENILLGQKGELEND